MLPTSPAFVSESSRHARWPLYLHVNHSCQLDTPESEKHSALRLLTNKVLTPSRSNPIVFPVHSRWRKQFSAVQNLLPYRAHRALHSPGASCGPPALEFGLKEPKAVPTGFLPVAKTLSLSLFIGLESAISIRFWYVYQTCAHLLFSGYVATQPANYHPPSTCPIPNTPEVCPCRGAGRPDP